MLETAFEALRKFDWGTDLAVLNPIEDAAIAAHDKPEVSKDLESRLIAALKGELSLDAQEYVCRKLATVGTAAAVPTLAPLLLNKEISHMSRFALEQIPGAEASQALLEALPKVTGNQKIGVISSIGARRDSAAVAALGALLKDADPAIARSAAMSLGTIGNAESAAALQAALAPSGANPQSIVDALLSCAESLLADNKRADANAIYTKFAAESQPRIVRLAATRGLLSCASKQA